MIPPAIQISNLCFKYSDQQSLFTGLNLTVEAGDRFGLFGPNGAGKTSLMNLMTGLLPYHEGSIQLLGNPIQKSNKNVKKLFGFVPQDFSFYEELTPKENLEFFGAWSGLGKQEIKQRSNELFKILELDAVKNKAVKKFSGGMKRKVNLAIGVIHNPRLLFLDEPTVGVDIETRQEIISYLKRLNESGTTLIYTSHQLSEAEELCNKIALISNGKIIAFDTLDNLLQEHGKQDLEDLFVHLTGKAYE
ncbi:ABC transporter ATP-binding protein [Parafilimonas sp.]|uniref:ABC transporter ATP-binding protein n=1 Tax=Parafilimonas sp. TaxID=1969739 RepID=UPI0039E6EB10